MHPRRPQLNRIMIAILCAGVALFALRVSGAWDLLDNDQIRPAAYALDAVVHGNWIVQTDFKGEVTSKPPVYTWLVALLSYVFGGVNRVSLYLPCGAAITGTALLGGWLAGRRFGARAGLIAGLAILLSPLGMKHMALARTDAVFALTTSLAGVLGLLAWEGKRSWVWFYLACALATLTKGPLGAALGGAGLLAMVWERKNDSSTEQAGGHALGIALFLAMTAGWFYLAYLQLGGALIDKMIGRELVGHAVRSDNGSSIPGASLAVPTLYFLARFAPWSIPAVFGIVRTIRETNENPEQRRCARYLVCWFLFGLGVFSIAPHQRADHLMPILLPAAVLGGREVSRWFADWSDRKVAIGAWAAVMLTLGAGYYWYHIERRDGPLIRRLASARVIAEEINVRGNTAPDRIVFTPGTSVIQVLLGTKQTRVSDEEALDLVLDKPELIIAVRRTNEFTRKAGARGIELMRIDGIAETEPHYALFQLIATATEAP